MDALIAAAAGALATGDALRALKCVALREDAPALALRGIAFAQLGEFGKARQLLRRAARAFGEGEAPARARCVVAEIEIALATNDIPRSGTALDAAAKVLAARGDANNALFARLVNVRRLVLLGRTAEAAKLLAAQPAVRVQPRLVAAAELLAADIATRELSSDAAHAALERARRAAEIARIPQLLAEVRAAELKLSLPVARLVSGVESRPVALPEVAALLRSKEFLVDACRREVRQGAVVVSLVTRPILFALVAQLAQLAPDEVTRGELIQTAFGLKRVAEPQRVRLRVEMGRLRKLLAPLAEVIATDLGFALVPRRAKRVLSLLPPELGEGSSLTALLGGGGSWSTSALAAALGKSQRAVQRALSELESAGKVRGIGRGRARRWVAPPSSGFATTLLLVSSAPLG